MQGSEFLQGFRSADQSSFSNAWDEIQRPQGGVGPTNFPFEQPRLQQDFDGNLEKFFSIDMISLVHCSSSHVWFSGVFFYLDQQTCFL